MKYQIIVTATALATALCAQIPTKPDSPQVKEHLDKARAIAGDGADTAIDRNSPNPLTDWVCNIDIA